MKIKVLLISNMYPSSLHPNYGIFVRNFENGIIENSGIVHKAVIKGSGKNIIQKILKYIKLFFDVYISLCINKYDVIYVHYAEHSLIPLLPIKFLLKNTLVVNAHGDDILYNSLISKLVAPIIKKADLLVVPSEYFFDIAKKKNLNNHIFISPSGGIDTSIFGQFNLKKDISIFTIGYVSRIDEGKGWDTLLLAIYDLKKHIKVKFKVIIIGGGAQENELKKMVEQLQLQNDVEFFGIIPHKELGNHYNTFDLFVFPTRLSESLGLVGIEAMACGLPVIGSNIGGLKGYIRNGYNGFIFEAGNNKELTIYLEKFISLDDYEKKFYCKNALTTARDYDSKLINKILYDRLEKLLQRSDENSCI